MSSKPKSASPTGKGNKNEGITFSRLQVYKSAWGRRYLWIGSPTPNKSISTRWVKHRTQTDLGQLPPTVNPLIHTPPSAAPPSPPHLDRIPAVRPNHAPFQGESSS